MISMLMRGMDLGFTLLFRQNSEFERKIMMFFSLFPYTLNTDWLNVQQGNLVSDGAATKEFKMSKIDQNHLHTDVIFPFPVQVKLLKSKYSNFIHCFSS